MLAVDCALCLRFEAVLTELEGVCSEKLRAVRRARNLAEQLRLQKATGVARRDEYLMRQARDRHKLSPHEAKNAAGQPVNRPKI
jgi:hypothetical protein